MKMGRRSVALTAVAIALAVLSLPHEAAAQRKFTFAYDQPRTTAYGIAADIFDAKLKELSGGKLSIDQFPGAQLGQEPVVLQKLRTGDIDFAITSTANASTPERTRPSRRPNRRSPPMQAPESCWAVRSTTPRI